MIINSYKKTTRKRLSYKKIFWTGFALIVVIIIIPSIYKSIKSLAKGDFSMSQVVSGKDIDCFGVSVPAGYHIHGIDISHHQKNINWETVAAIDEKGINLKFAFIKATEGITRQDRHFERNWRKSKEAGLVRGAYHFYYPTRDPRKQAENFIKQVTLEEGDLPPVLDIEVSKNKSKEDIVAGCLVWCEIIEEHYGVKPIIYTSANFYDRYLKDDFEDYPLWVAHYYESIPRMEHRSWHFWQYSDCAVINGIGNNVDINVFNGDLEELTKLCIR